MSDVRLSISVDANQGRQALQQFKGDYTAMADQLRKPLGQIAALHDLQAGLGDSARQLEAARARLRDLAGELVAAEQPTRAQARAYEVAAQQARGLEESIVGQKNRLSELTASLRLAGVDTSRLGAEQKRLAAELAQATAAADLQQSRVAGARAALGVRAHSDIQGAIGALARQYQILKREGRLTLAEPSLRGFYEIARRAAVYIGGDTGPTHIAIAAGAPTVGIFGPTEWWRNGSLAAGDICVSRDDIDCRIDCHRRTCDKWICMDISVETVFNAVRQRIGT